jgi:subtilisin family serine protease
VRVLNSSGTGATSDVIAGLEWVLAHHTEWQIKAVNLSLGGGSFAGVCDTANANTLLYAQAAQALRDAGLTLFAASGNSGKAEEMMAPACVSRVVAVGNLYDTPLPRLDWPTCADEAVIPGRVPCSSNSSSALDLLAPGVSINATWLGGGQAVRSGTSMSTPHAVAVAALLWQAAPELRPDELEAALIETGPLVTDTRQGRVTPRLDALAAVEHVRSTISGTARLQGRTDHSGVSIFLAGEDCQPPQAVTVTDTAGHFEVSFNAAQSAPYLCATHPGYLTARRNAAGGEAADVILPGGDVTGDNIINIFDIARIASRYGGSDPVADVNGDGHVDIFDLTIAAGNYNKSGPFSWP